MTGPKGGMAGLEGVHCNQDTLVARLEGVHCDWSQGWHGRIRGSSL